MAQGSAHGLWDSAPERCLRFSGLCLCLCLCSKEKCIRHFKHHALFLVVLKMLKYESFARGRSRFICIFNTSSANIKLDLVLFKLIENGKLVSSTPTVGKIHKEIRVNKFLPSPTPGIEIEAGISTCIAVNLRSLDLHVCLHISF